MNNSFDRLIDGMCATLRTEVLTRLDDTFARGQVLGVINVLNTFKVRADWSAGFLLQQIEAQQRALRDAEALLRRTDLAGVEDLIGDRGTAVLPPVTATSGAVSGASIDALLAARDDANRAIAAWLAWLDAERARLPEALARDLEGLFRSAMRAEIDIELKNSPRPLFAEMSSGREA